MDGNYLIAPIGNATYYKPSLPTNNFNPIKTFVVPMMP